MITIACLQHFPQRIIWKRQYASCSAFNSKQLLQRFAVKYVYRAGFILLVRYAHFRFTTFGKVITFGYNISLGICAVSVHIAWAILKTAMLLVHAIT